VTKATGSFHRARFFTPISFPGNLNYLCYCFLRRFVASASFDKSVRLWDGRTGKFLATLRAHVQVRK